jgi:hypothetical protein
LDQLGQTKLCSFLNRTAGIQAVSNSRVRQDPGYLVGSYLELAAKVAELHFRNRDFNLLFRGQPIDHTTGKRLTTLRPSIFRPEADKKLLSKTVLKHRLERLAVAEKLLTEKFKSLKRLGRQRVERQRLLRWAMLQHYKVCETPLLDVTQSLRIAASFASDGEGDDGFVYVFAIPHLSGAVTANAEAGVQVVRLSGACPPSALRPHIQEGFLLGEYPDFVSIDQAEYYKPYQLDFGRRLIGKFRFHPDAFWQDDNFPQVPHEALYPPSKGWFEQAIGDIKEKVSPPD